MDTVPLVEGQIDDGWSLLTELDRRGFIVRAACWIKPIDEDRWSLYIATPAVDEQGALSAYGEVLRVLRSLGRVWITSSSLNLVGEKHPIVEDILDLLSRFPGGTRTPFPLSYFGGVPVEEVYVYPRAIVEVPIYSSFFRGQPGGSGVTFSLEPFNPDRWLEIGDRAAPKERYHADISQSWVVAAPEGSCLERDEFGQLVLAWDFRGNRVRSSAQDLWSLAKLGLQGFRFLREPVGSLTGTVEVPPA
jgi:hypothetical protein